MSEIKEIQNYLKKTLEILEDKILEALPPAYQQLAEISADIFDTEDVLELISLHGPYRKDALTERAHKAYLDNLILFFKAKKLFENGEFTNTIDTLLTYHLQLGQIDQNLTDEEGFKEKESRRSKAGTDKLYGPDRAIREEVCKLLQKHKPEEGWKDRTAAAKSVFPDLERFFKANCSGSNLKLENLDSYINKWMKNSKYEPYDAFKETASLEWLRKNHKSNC